MEECRIIYKDLELDVVGYYTPEYDGVRYYPDGSGEPPSAATFEAEEVYLADCNTNIYSLVEHDISEIERLACETYE